MPQILASAATVIGLVWSVYGDQVWESGVWAFWTAVGLLLASLATQIVIQRPSYMEARRLQVQAEGESSAKSEAIHSSIELLLRHVAEHCDMASNKDRVSVYYFHVDQFVILARYSIHPDYRLWGRRHYSKKQGAIGDAWDAGWVVTTLRDTNRAAWESRLVKRHGFTPEEASGLVMQCHSLAALRIEVNHAPVGVIVFESMGLSRATTATLDKARSSKLYAALGELVSAAAPMTPGVQELSKGSDLGTAPTWTPVPRP